MNQSSKRLRGLNCVILLVLAAVIGVLINGCSNDDRSRHDLSGSQANQVKPGRVQILSLPAADARGGRRKVWVYRPGVPNSRFLPVVYFLHGIPRANYRYLAKVGMRHTLDHGFESGRWTPFVLVVPDGHSTGARDGEWADSVNGKVQLESFVTGSLIRAVEGRLRRPERDRAITGFSMGGYGAMNLALRHPGLYGEVAPVAGYFHVYDPSGIFQGNRKVIKANTPFDHVRRARGKAIFLADPTGDTERLSRHASQQFARKLRSVGVHPVMDVGPGRHNTAYITAELPHVFDFLTSVWRGVRP